MSVWKAAADLLGAGGAGALATVAQARGSTPVPAGTKMLVGAEGRLIGSVGGGCVEADVIAAALMAQRERQPLLLTHHLNADLAGDLGLSCGGTVAIFVRPRLRAAFHVAGRRQAAAAECGRVRTATTWKDGPVKMFEELPPGDKGAAASLSEGGRFVEERLSLAPRVLVFGAGHVGAAIARAAAAAGFRVIVIDDRVEYADPSRFPAGTGVVVGDRSEEHTS